MKASPAEMNDTEFYRRFVLGCLEREVEPWAVKYLQQTFDGDAESAESLSCALGNELRGAVAVELWKARIPRAAFRAFLASVWDHDHHHLMSAVGSRRRLGALFRYAAFKLPADWPNTVQAWRGTSGTSVAEAMHGHSWSVDRDTACWFAMRSAWSGAAPLVVVADFPRSDIVMYHDGRSEREIVVINPPTQAWVDGDATEWADASARQSALNQDRQKALMAKPVAWAE